MVTKRRDAPMIYAPARPPRDEAALGDYVYRELTRVGDALRASRMLVVPTCYVAPAKPVEGQLVRADGVHWDPGEGVGYYCYWDGNWQRWAVERDKDDKDEKDVNDGEDHNDY
ncbi:MAG: hypothetical protein G8D89_06630 [gamma proteobacterium symbiont of Clathrolucina costata]|uniref:Uncharacterized protein n=1 Tax=Candidatus Thiodiazotropha taylori TaxID=2792791 RepID=A0A9E4NMI8_9GAMM|nr:hypothetical protein [Candidatus Thiodiazotropha taylori]MCW4238036.1 hypothetical protein [Candidatus Thiodiazotropha endolucinida]